MNFFLFLALFIFSLSSSVSADYKKSIYDRVVESGKISCGYFIWPPYIIKDPNNGKMSGINYDYMMEIGKILGLEIEWVDETTPGSAITGLNTRRYDVMCASVWPDKARLKHSLLTDPAFYSTVYAVVRADNASFDDGARNINDPSVTIAALEGDVTYNLATANYPAAKINASSQMEDSSYLFHNIVNKKADITFVDKGIVKDFNATNNNSLKLVKGLPPIALFPEALMVKRGEVELRMLLDHAIREITDSGKIDDFISKYPDNDYFPPKESWKKKQ